MVDDDKDTILGHISFVILQDQGRHALWVKDVEWTQPWHATQLFTNLGILKEEFDVPYAFATAKKEDYHSFIGQWNFCETPPKGTADKYAKFLNIEVSAQHGLLHFVASGEAIKYALISRAWAPALPAKPCPRAAEQQQAIDKYPWTPEELWKVLEYCKTHKMNKGYGQCAVESD